MKHREPIDLRMTNDRTARKRQQDERDHAARAQRLADYHARTKPVRDRVRLLPLLEAGLRNGWVGK